MGHMEHLLFPASAQTPSSENKRGKTQILIPAAVQGHAQIQSMNYTRVLVE